MDDDACTLIERERRVAHRLARLFRLDRAGHFARRPDEVAQRLRERRAGLIDEMLGLDRCRRAVDPRVPPELGFVMQVLAREAGFSQEHCLERLSELGVELRRRRAGGGSTGLRDAVAGRVLGRG